MLHRLNEKFPGWTVCVRARMRECWVDDRVRERSSRRRQKCRFVNLYGGSRLMFNGDGV